VRAIELVTAGGEQRTVDAENDPDLFWALRGGGGGYALVAALHLNLVPISEIYAGALVFPAELGADAVRAYCDWAAGVSDDVTSVVRFITPPPLPDVPEPIRGRPLLTELRHLGGALARPDENGGALDHLDAEFALFGVGMMMSPEMGQAIDSHLDRVTESMQPWAAEGGYFNFAERPCDADAIRDPPTETRPRQAGSSSRAGQPQDRPRRRAWK
jgi:hypothetical protein